MDIKKMLEAQKELDKANMKKGGLTEYPLDMVQTAYRVELGELLQEWKQFKYWKLNKGEIDREKMLEEWADCIHFALSLGNYVNGKLQITPDEADCKRLIGILKKKPEQYNMYDMIDKCFDVDIDVLSATIGLGIALGYTLEELEQAYWKKNIINWERIEGGY